MKSVRKILLVCAVALILGAGFTACQKEDGGGSGKESEGYATRAAMLAGPNVKCVNPGQYQCPVTEEKISANHYVDTDQGRVYFHSEEAKNKFQQNPDQYLSAVKKQE